MDNKKIDTDIADIEQKIAALPKMHYSYVFSRFEKAIEKEYYDDLYLNSIILIRVLCAMSFILVAAFGILDSWILPFGKHIAWFLRYAVMCPFVLLCFIFSFFPFFKKLMQPVLCMLCLLIAFGISVMIAIAKDTEVANNLYYAGLLEVLFALYTLCRIRFIYAVVVGWTIVVFYEVAE
jgi:hypothetical protein